MGRLGPAPRGDRQAGFFWNSERERERATDRGEGRQTTLKEGVRDRGMTGREGGMTGRYDREV